MTGENELQAIKNWVTSNRAWILTAIFIAFAIFAASMYYLLAGRRLVTSATSKPNQSNLTTISPIQKTDLQITSQVTGGQPPVTSVKLNDQKVDMPANGSIHKVINSSNGTTTVDVSSEAQSSGVNNVSSNSSTSLEVNSVSQSSGNTTSGQ